MSIINNYHTHTKRCKHAYGEDEDYILSAISSGMKELGFSDHSPWKYKDINFQPTMRMELSEFHDYKKSILALKEKYKDNIEIKLGLECEYFEDYIPWLKEFAKEQDLDYLILGAHYYESDETGFYFGHKCYKPEYLKLYVDECIKGMETGLFSYLAHPDLFTRSVATKSSENVINECRRLCKAAKQYNIPLEYNLAGVRYNKRYGTRLYPCHDFWEIAAEVRNDVIIGYDAHKPTQLEDTKIFEQAHKYLTSLGVNIITQLECKTPWRE